MCSADSWSENWENTREMHLDKIRKVGVYLEAKEERWNKCDWERERPRWGRVHHRVMVAGANQLLTPCRLSVVPTNDAVTAVTFPLHHRLPQGAAEKEEMTDWEMERSNDEMKTIQLHQTCVARYTPGRWDYGRDAVILGEDGWSSVLNWSAQVFSSVQKLRYQNMESWNMLCDLITY